MQLVEDKVENFCKFAYKSTENQPSSEFFSGTQDKLKNYENEKTYSVP